MQGPIACGPPRPSSSGAGVTLFQRHDYVDYACAVCDETKLVRMQGQRELGQRVWPVFPEVVQYGPLGSCRCNAGGCKQDFWIKPFTVASKTASCVLVAPHTVPRSAQHLLL